MGTQYGGEITIQNNWDVKQSLELYLFLQAALHTVQIFVIFTI